MTKLFLRLLVKDYHNTRDPAVRAAIGKLGGLAGIICNLLLCTAKILAGILSGSVSIIADALNNLSDATSSIVTLVGFRLAQQPADKEHPYGHARYEYLSGLAVAALILVIGAELVVSSVKKIIAPTEVDISILTLAILLCSIGLKAWMTVFYRSLSKAIDSSALSASAADSRNDVIATSAVFVGSLIQIFFDVNIDGYIGFVVALFILYSGIQVARETSMPLIGKRADAKQIEQIGALILSHEKILGIHDLMVHDYGPGQYFASVHAEISAEEDPLLCHEIIDHIECDVLEQMNVHLVIHYDPVEVHDEEWNQAKTIVEEIVSDIGLNLSAHDFRLVRGSQQTKLVFDLAVPYHLSHLRKEFKHKIDDALLAKGMDYITVIRFDGVS